MVTTWPPNFPVLGVACNLFAQWVDIMSGGRLKIKVYGAGELIPALECFDAVTSGTAEIANGVAYYWAGKSAATQFFAGVPFGMNAQQLNAWIYSGGGQALYDELYSSFNLVPFLGGNTGVQMGGWFNKEINTIDDFKGLKMRMPGLGGKVLERVGAAAVLSAGSEIFTNLERGVIDATEWIGPYHDYKMGFHKIAKYYYGPGWHEPGTALEYIVNKNKFDRLSSDLQEIVRTAAARANVWVLSEFEAKNNAYLKLIRNEFKVQLRTFSPAVLSQLRLATESIIQEIILKDTPSRKVYASYTKFKTDVKSWSEITEKEFYNHIQ
ncbi:UNVERIFIED_CONTAM: hypothetical protein GTU68_048457 [Idotea baltica]|nr:hypothetical protein [Idotea baltica]